MDKVTFLPLIPGILFGFLMIKERLVSFSAKGLKLKMATSLCFLLTAIAGLFFNRGLFGIIVVMVLLTGCIGDFELDLKFVDCTRDYQHTMKGMAAFSAAHILLMVAMYSRFLRYYESLVLILACIMFLALLFGFVFMQISVKMGNEYGDLYKPVLIYSCIMLMAFFMAIFDAGLLIKSRVEGNALCIILLLIGMLFFVISDAFLSMTYFGKDKIQKMPLVMNCLLYYTGQFLIAFSILFA